MPKFKLSPDKRKEKRLEARRYRAKKQKAMLRKYAPQGLRCHLQKYGLISIS